jgi:hypothetical protein
LHSILNAAGLNVNLSQTLPPLHGRRANRPRGEGSSRDGSAPRRAAAVYRFFLRPFDPPLAVPVAPDGTILICCSLALLRTRVVAAASF